MVELLVPPPLVYKPTIRTPLVASSQPQLHLMDVLLPFATLQVTTWLPPRFLWASHTFTFLLGRPPTPSDSASWFSPGSLPAAAGCRPPSCQLRVQCGLDFGATAGSEAFVPKQKQAPEWQGCQRPAWRGGHKGAACQLKDENCRVEPWVRCFGGRTALEMTHTGSAPVLLARPQSNDPTEPSVRLGGLICVQGEGGAGSGTFGTTQHALGWKARPQFWK
uniref:Uncharacterized protein LOC123615962 n=1 Tax=Camelus bactrianus TaxID=9837 RepID=A0A9W3G136_CAMBA|nr:uncharacterized protein LOC123615962 [Camelus bactrianus]